MDEAAERHETEMAPRDRNPKYNYSATHDLFVSNHISDQLQYSILMVAVYGRLSNERMQEAIQELGQRPHTQALLKDQFQEKGNENEPFYDEKGGKQDVINLNEDGTEKLDTKPEDAKVKELEKKLKKLQKENEKLKKTVKGGKKDSSCCTIF